MGPHSLPPLIIGNMCQPHHLQGQRGKRLADSAEALLGVLFLSAGGTQGLRLLQPCQPAENNQGNEVAVHHSPPLAPSAGAAAAAGAQWDGQLLVSGLMAVARLCERLYILPPGSLSLIQDMHPDNCSTSRPEDVASHTHKLPAAMPSEGATAVPSRSLPNLQAQRAQARTLHDQKLIQGLSSVLGGHRFTNPALAWEAVTHCSFTRSPSNQRLEFLGDAVLDVVVTSFLLKRAVGDAMPMDRASTGVDARRARLSLDPAQLTTARSSLVCNAKLALICARSGLSGHLRVGLMAVQRAVNAYVEKVGGVYEAHVSGAATLGKSDASNQLDTELGVTTTTLAPSTVFTRPSRGNNDDGDPTLKLLADLVESVLGAVFLDSKGSLQAVWVAFLSLVAAAGMNLDTMLGEVGK